NVPIEEIEAHQVEIAPSHPPDAREEGQPNRRKCEQPKHRATIPATGMNDPRPDAAQLAPQQEKEPQAGDAMEREDAPLLAMPTGEADQPGGAGDASRDRQAPVGDTRPHAVRVRSDRPPSRNRIRRLELAHRSLPADLHLMERLYRSISRCGGAYAVVSGQTQRPGQLVSDLGRWRWWGSRTPCRTFAGVR